jgi:hypothetical protein
MNPKKLQMSSVCHRQIAARGLPSIVLLLKPSESFRVESNWLTGHDNLFKRLVSFKSVRMEILL